MLMPILLLAIFLSIALSLVLWSWHLERQRTEALAGIAPQLGFAFSAGEHMDLVDALDEFSLGSSGRSRAATNVLAGQVDATEVLIFDYQYTIGSGKSRHTVSQTVMLLRWSDGEIPAFFLRPEGMLHKISEMLGYNDIDIAANPRFSKLYLLKGASEPAIRELFSGDVLAFYESKPGLWTETNGQALLFYRIAKRVKPEDIAAFYQDGWTAYALLRRIPATAG